MTTWDNLLDGYDLLGRIHVGHSSMTADAWNSGLVPDYYLQSLDLIYPLFKFVFTAFVSSGVLIALFFGVWALIVTPVLRRFARP